tara:strand:+ start:416 stop:745 length:330 start_codon:yes stop_codon:yes gene_type:complete
VGLRPHSLIKGKNMSSDQKFTTLTADGQVKTASGGSTNIGPARVTYIQASGITNLKLYDAATASGDIVFEATFGSEGLDIYVPGNGIRFQNTIFADITGSGSVTLGYTG